MRYGIFSDIHGNLEALLAVLAAFRQETIDSYLCVGDIVGYGANPGECIDRIQEMPITTVAGNHDWAVIENVDMENFNPIAKEAVLWTRAHLSEGQKAFLGNLPLKFKNEDLIMVHSTLQNPEKFDYLDDFYKAAEMFSLMDKRVCFIGHSHVPMIIRQHESQISCTAAGFVEIEPDQKYIINVGSVGQPRDRNKQAAYCIYDTESNTVAIKRIPYPITEAQNKIMQAGLPERLAQRLALGH